jgi:hypothetical protein
VFRRIRDHLGTADGRDERLAPDFDLGVTGYVFQSEGGTDYTYSHDRQHGEVFVQFAAPDGGRLDLLFEPRGSGRERSWFFSIWVDDQMLGDRSFLRASEVAGPLRQLLRAAILALNTESDARRQRQQAAIERAGGAAPLAARLPTPLDRLRGDFDLGDEDYDFVTARGWEYSYLARSRKAYAATAFTAPSGADVMLLFIPETAGSRREVRLLAVVDEVDVNDDPFLTVRQFPEPIQWLIRNAIADLNAESEARAVRRGEILNLAGRRPDTHDG